MAYYDRIKEARKAKKLTQRQISEMVGVATTTFNGYENGNREPSMYTLSKIMETLDVDANYLFQDEMNIKKSSESIKIDSEEQELVAIYRNMNPQGQEKLVEYARDLSETGKYKKDIAFEKIG